MAEHRSPFILKFSGLSNGEHEFNWELDYSFFKGRPDEQVHDCRIRVKALLQKGTGALQIVLSIAGTLTVKCVRCLEELDLPINVEKTLLIRRSEQASHEEDDDDALFILPSAHEIDIDSTLYDYLLLQIPYSPVHDESWIADGRCVPVVHEGSGINKEETKIDDNRWAALKNFKLN